MSKSSPHQAGQILRIHCDGGDGGARVRVGRVPVEHRGQPGAENQHHPVQLRETSGDEYRRRETGGVLRDR